MPKLRILPFAFMLLAAPLAHAEVYKCVDADGRVTYTNDRNVGRGCKQLSQDQSVSTMPPPARSPASPGAAASPTFPRVTPDAQRARDDSRRQVLEKELATEEAALAEARKSLGEQEAVRLGDERNYQRVLDRLQPFKDKVDLHERNIEALKREIANLR
ncbi:DUF4124 domain-containing protein [Azoarcus olearius]|uniref:Conserved hypothetical secreted protein n=1 Tax=Azoarcus sp. (strain BH72) TaxID=418699 RepID=A1K3E9_AZOSB|nr:DUF4124 domain-containing protein [Azoarcus olearius]ANQ83881.1 hypothetical protein dqs_0811 [Azoarcus olearius]CAL93354.1 conserved hypothetical secreted protein [Azoarcus olearius]